MIGKTLFMAAIITLFAWAAVGAVFGQNRPPTQRGAVLEIEMAAYVDHFIDNLNMDADFIRYTVMVLPTLEFDTPALSYSWPVDPDDPTLWLVMFTFDEDITLQMPPRLRRAMAAHEVAHIYPPCMQFRAPAGVVPSLRNRYYLLEESCADITAGDQTSNESVLALLTYLNIQWPDSRELPTRIEVMKKVIAMGGMPE